MSSTYGFVISLVDRNDRREAFKSRALAEKLEFEFVDAHKGNGLLASNQFACSASHLKAISKFIDSGREWCVIFEDDADLCQDFVKVAELKMRSTVELGGDFSYLGGFGFATEDFTSDTWKEWKGRGAKVRDGLYQAIVVDGAHCYAINHQAAVTITRVGASYLEFFRTAGFAPVISPPLNLTNPGFDNLLNDMVIRGLIRATVSYPVLSNQVPGFSNIEKEDLSRPILRKFVGDGESR